jgi:hypothetical protein
VSKSHSGGDYVTSDAGVIYLPFCENCLVEVVSCIKQLSEVFVITFMTKHELDEHTLWKATNTVDAESMQNWLGKKLGPPSLLLGIQGLFLMCLTGLKMWRRRE